jgi:hypothetical protein
MSRGRYAERTRVPTDRSRMEIERTLEKYGATSFAYAQREGRAMVAFELSDRRIRMTIALPQPAASMSERERIRASRIRRERWRALLLSTKAKLVSVSSGIETVEQAFMAHLVLATGKTLHEQLAPELAKMTGGGGGPLLPPGDDS